MMKLWMVSKKRLSHWSEEAAFLFPQQNIFQKMEARLKIAIQKSGRLSEGSRQLLKECGISISNGKNRLLAKATNFPLDVLYLRDDDIPQYVEDGIAHIGILGANVVEEADCQVNMLRPLGFSKCRLSLALPKSTDYKGIQDFEGKKIATSYPNITQSFLAQYQITADIHEISGSVEIAPNIGLADAVCDIVSSGSTLFSNGLKEVEVILKSEAVLIAQPQLAPALQAILDKLLFRMQAVQSAENNKYIILNSPNDKVESVTEVLPGMKSPTVVPLAQSGWSAIHSVISEDEFWEVIDELKDRGAEGILVVPIEKMIA
jgi:ATP phosphoribosyltransferase